MADDDVSMMVELLRMVRREQAEGFESIREEQKRLRESIDVDRDDRDDHAQRIAVLEQTTVKRRAGIRK
jgi:hypothetical protein